MKRRVDDSPPAYDLAALETYFKEHIEGEVYNLDDGGFRLTLAGDLRDKNEAFLDALFVRVVAYCPDLTELMVNGHGLSYLPLALFELQHLQNLHLSGNALSDVPVAIHQLTALRVLYLDQNRFSHFPEAVCGLSGLEELNISYNSRLFALPHAIGRMQALRFLNMRNCVIRYLPHEIGSLLRLETLNLCHNQISVLPHSIVSLPCLAVLYLGGLEQHANPLVVVPKCLLGLPNVNMNAAFGYSRNDFVDEKTLWRYLPVFRDRFYSDAAQADDSLFAVAKAIERAVAERFDEVLFRDHHSGGVQYERRRIKDRVLSDFREGLDTLDSDSQQMVAAFIDGYTELAMKDYVFSLVASNYNAIKATVKCLKATRNACRNGNTGNVLRGKVDDYVFKHIIGQGFGLHENLHEVVHSAVFDRNMYAASHLKRMVMEEVCLVVDSFARKAIPDVDSDATLDDFVASLPLTQSFDNAAVYGGAQEPVDDLPVEGRGRWVRRVQSQPVSAHNSLGDGGGAAGAVEGDLRATL